MPDIWMDVDTALAEVPVNLMPLIDDTDFKTVEDAIAYNAAGMDLRWNFVTTGGAMTSTPVTPTTGGAHDWTHQGDGLYTLEIPASGGTINNNAKGFGWFSGKINGVLPFRGPVIGFRMSGANDALIDGGSGSGFLDVNVIGWLGNTPPDSGEDGVPQVIPRDGSITAAKIATGAIDADSLASDAVTAIQSGLATASSLSTVAGNVASILADTGTDGVVVAAGSKTGYALTSGERDSIAAAILDLAAGIQTDWTLREALRVILAVAAGKINGADTSTVNIRDVGDSKNRVVATVDATGRTAVTYDKS